MFPIGLFKIHTQHKVKMTANVPLHLRIPLRETKVSSITAMKIKDITSGLRDIPPIRTK
jgi:hypothetical protein